MYFYFNLCYAFYITSIECELNRVLLKFIKFRSLLYICIYSEYYCLSVCRCRRRTLVLNYIQQATCCCTITIYKIFSSISYSNSLPILLFYLYFATYRSDFIKMGEKMWLTWSHHIHRLVVLFKIWRW